MSFLKTWGELHEIYEKTNRGALVTSLYKNKKIKDSWPYFVTIILCAIITFFVFNLWKNHASAGLLVFIEAAAIVAWINVLIGYNYKELCISHKINKLPFYQKQKFISYLLFADKLNKSNIISKDGVELLVKWESIRSDKYNVFSYFDTKIILIVFTMISVVVSGYFLEQIKENPSLLMLFLFTVFCCILFLWSFTDTINSYTKKNKEICQFLQWWRIDKIT